MGILERGSGFISRLQNQSGDRPPFEGIYVYLLALLVGYAIADLSLLYFRPEMLPTGSLPPRPPSQRRHEPPAISAYGVITERNIFNADGKIPQELRPKDSGAPGTDSTMEAAPVLSQLPLDLEGTIVHINPARSVASVHLRSRGERKPFGVGDEIDRIARVTKIERRRLTFRNLNNNRLEYIELPQDSKIIFGMRSEAKSAGEDVQQRGDFEFSVNRGDINKYTSDLASILNQARMVPNIVPGSGGRVEGFRFVTIQPGSIYEKLGFKPMDIIKQVNGEPVNSPTKAMELYNALRTENRITLQVEREGREESFTYDINE